ncbi:MAG: NYN domain-containing protein [Rhodoferax sp.]|nr:NYN domain-containing protein [Rhodoferax sp.]
MTYLIDGHNLIGQLDDIHLSDPDDEAKLVMKLRGFAARTGKRCVVIFDNGLPAGHSHLSGGAVEVLFASPHTNADALMIGRIRRARDPASWTVVSSDRMVLEQARAKRMTSVPSPLFAAELRRLNVPLSVPTKAEKRLGVKDVDPGEAPNPAMSRKDKAYFAGLFGVDKKK